MKRLNFYLATILLCMLCCANAWGGNTIYYTSTEGVVGPDNSAFGGAQIVSNTCTDGQGTIVFDRDLTTIGQSAFDDCPSLTSITLPESVTKIGGCAFEGCTSLTSINIPESVTEIGYRVFYECSSLESINIPKSVTTIGVWAFYGCSSLTSITVDFENKVYDSRNDCNAIIKTATNTLVAGCATTVIPENVTTIGEGAFEKCTSLTSITLPESVTEIGESAFQYCTSLESINIPKSVTTIGVWAFYGCSSLTSVPLPNSLTTIGEWAFGFCESLTSITLPESVTEISGEAFFYCSSLTSITLPDSLKSIGEDAFKNCTSLESINIPKSVTEIGGSAFNLCESLTSVTVNWLTPLTVPDNLFANIPYLSSVTLNVPAGTADLYHAADVWKEFNIVEQLDYSKRVIYYTSTEGVVGPDNSAFGGAQIVSNTCTDGQGTIVFDKDVTEIGYRAFRDCTSLTSITLPDSLKSIGVSAFEGCTSLTSINIPEGVTTIGEDAFCACSSLESINIPESVTTIGVWAFGLCFESLTSVTVNWATPLTVTSGVFDGIDLSSVTLNVPAGTTEAYKSADVWKEFNIIETISDADKSAAIGSLAAIVGDINDEDITHMLNKYISQIQSATSATEMISAQTEGEEVLTAMVKLYHRLNVDLPSEGTTGHGVRVILEKEGETDKVLELMNPSRVEFFKR